MPTEPPTWRNMGPGVRKIPEPMTEPMNKRKRSRRRSVRTSSIMEGRVRAILRGEQAERIITGDLEPSRRTWRKGNRGRHEAEHENNQGQERPEPPVGIQRSSIVNLRDTQKAHHKQQRAPNVPTLPEMKPAESNQADGQQERKNTVRAHAQRTQNVPAIELGHRHEIERSDKQRDPGGAAHRRQQPRVGSAPWMENGLEKAQQERRAVDQLRVRRIGKLRNEFRVEDAVEQRGNGEEKTHDRPRSANIKKGAIGAHR